MLRSPKQGLRRAGQRVARAVGGNSRPASDAGARALRQVAALRRQVERIEADLEESRKLNKRLAEITDVVAEVLLPAEQRDETRLRTLLEKYDRGI